MRTAAALLLAALLAACSGSGPSSSGTITPAPSLRQDLLFGYYGGCATFALEQADHANLYWATGWCGSSTWHLAMAEELTLARGAGFRHIVLALPVGLVWQPNARAELHFQLSRLDQAGLLAGWDTIMVYPQDEPDILENGPRSNEEVLAMLRWLREELAAFPALSRAPVGVFYACSTGRRPGLAGFDWVGCDDYDRGCSVLEGGVRELAQALRPDQRLMLIPGGVDPWRQDPACFEARAHADPQVVALVPFLWQDYAAAGLGPGIRSNPTRRLYCEAGRKITQRATAC